jgi:hypothetical protein
MIEAIEKLFYAHAKGIIDLKEKLSAAEKALEDFREQAGDDECDEEGCDS